MTTQIGTATLMLNVDSTPTVIFSVASDASSYPSFTCVLHASRMALSWPRACAPPILFMPVEWIPQLTDMGSSDSVEVRSLDAHYLRPLFKAIFTESSLSYGYLSRSSSHLRFPRCPEMVMRLRWLAFWTRDIALGEGDEKFIVGDSGSLASRCLSLVQLVMAMNSPSSATE
nr:hypothetical protein Iba_chr05fCG7040 [Ipomoea batatas]